MEAELTNSISHLLPCPFCGAPASTAICSMAIGSRYIISCQGDCLGPATTAAELDDATVQWNARPERDALVAEQNALAKTLLDVRDDLMQADNAFTATKAERDRLQKEVETLETNARSQATLLADTGRERDALRERLREAEAVLKECAIQISQTRNRKLTSDEQSALDSAHAFLSSSKGEG